VCGNGDDKGSARGVLAVLRVPMRATVAAAFFPWVGQFEGLTCDDGTPFTWMGLDEEGRVATALGCDIDAPASASLLVWHRADGSIASSGEVAAEWHRVKALQSARKCGGASSAFRSTATLFVDLPSLYAYLTRLLATQEPILRRSIPTWEDLPGVAQVARLRTSYAEGASKPWPLLDAALVRCDWTTAAAECMPGDVATQSAKYRQSYDAVRALYLVAADYPGDELPVPLPDGLGVA
jgi:hypothetical protein